MVGLDALHATTGPGGSAVINQVPVGSVLIAFGRTDGATPYVEQFYAGGGGTISEGYGSTTTDLDSAAPVTFRGGSMTSLAAIRQTGASISGQV